jgi:outer membrane protein TolC
LVAGTLLSACSLTPPLERPALPVAPAYADVPVANTGNGAGIDWRGMRPDPRLQQLVELALANNRDLRNWALPVLILAACSWAASATGRSRRN